jgi:hypothetical protein
MTSTHNPGDRQPGTWQPGCWPQLGDLAIDTAHGDSAGVIVGVPGEEGSLWLTFHLQPPGGGEEWSAPADASTLQGIPDTDALPRHAGEDHPAASRLAESASAETLHITASGGPVGTSSTGPGAGNAPGMGRPS